MIREPSRRLTGTGSGEQTASTESRAPNPRYYTSTQQRCIGIRQQLESIARTTDELGKEVYEGELKTLRTMIHTAIGAATGHITAMLEDLAMEYRCLPAVISPAAEAVFTTPELLEHIVLFCFTADVFNTNQVNRTFRDTVQSSVKLQRKLGLRPDTECDIYFPLKTAKVTLRADACFAPKTSSSPAIRLR